MIFEILTLFPLMFEGPFADSLIKKAVDKGLIKINLHKIRDFTSDKHKTVDDQPYGGGTGMVMKIEPIFKALEFLKKEGEPDRIILLSPQGKTFNSKIARELSTLSRIVIICGHYEGFDERIREYLITEEISIGDYVLTGGELPAMIIVDAVSRYISGVIKEKDSYENESFENNTLDYPSYTRPPSFKGMDVPEILLSGDHKKISRWRELKSLEKTLKQRPDILKDGKHQRDKSEIFS
ncbi:tRNA (guanosine(37)-N1)-methyltransferase TrmD [bacterium]|nr:tRNA (guanosine(37)-N1)-methyltransferase TrmD [bacterium]